jgi:universal stress protein family protein
MLLAELERQVHLDLAQVLPEVDAGEVEVARQVVVGSPSHEIVQFAAAEKIDLIVIATHGRSGFKQLFIGSVAERVIRTAPCPVMTMRPVVATAVREPAVVSRALHSRRGPTGDPLPCPSGSTRLAHASRDLHPPEPGAEDDSDRQRETGKPG